MILLAVVLIFIGLPYLLAVAWQGHDFFFSGFLLNPIDGNSYLAKMYQGWAGEWKFHLTYTAAAYPAQAGSGAYLFLFYLFLGHLARWLGLPLIVLFHVARLAGASVMVFSLAAFFQHIFAGQPPAVRLATWLAALGSGLGWLVLLSGLLPSDFWVAEAYPFLSAYANPHFPLGLALLLWMFLFSQEAEPRWKNLVWLAVLGLIESVVLPFGLPLAGVILAGARAWDWWEARSEWERKKSLQRTEQLLAALLPGACFVGYQLWVSLADPLLAGWNAQNLTPSPELWDFLLSFSPVLIFAVVGAWRLYHLREYPARKLLLSWFVIGLILIYMPFSLQRRFMLGFYIPSVGLAVVGARALAERMRRKWLIPTLVGLSMPTNLFLLLAGLAGIFGHSGQIYLSADEYHAIQWLAQQSAQNRMLQNGLVLASSEIGSFIPAYTGMRVIYGHPFETVNALTEEQSVQAFFKGDLTQPSQADFLASRGVDMIFYGPREEEMVESPLSPFRGFVQVFQSGAVTIWAREGPR